MKAPLAEGTSGPAVRGLFVGTVAMVVIAGLLRRRRHRGPGLRDPSVGDLHHLMERAAASPAGDAHERLLERLANADLWAAYLEDVTTPEGVSANVDVSSRPDAWFRVDRTAAGLAFLVVATTERRLAESGLVGSGDTPLLLSFRLLATVARGLDGVVINPGSVPSYRIPGEIVASFADGSACAAR